MGVHVSGDPSIYFFKIDAIIRGEIVRHWDTTSTLSQNLGER